VFLEPGLIRPYNGLLSISHRLFDLLSIAGCLWLACRFLGLTTYWWGAPAALGVVFYFALAQVCGLYKSHRQNSVGIELRLVLSIWSGVISSAVMVAYLTNTINSFSREAILIWFFSTPLVLITQRVLLRSSLHYFRTKGFNSRSVAIVGLNSTAFKLAEKIEESPWMGMKLVGIYDDRHKKRLPMLPTTSPTLRGNVKEMLEDSHSGKVDYVFITLPMQAEKRIVQLTEYLSDTTASVYIVPNLFLFDLLKARWTDLDGTPAISIFESPFCGIGGWIKRAEDLLLGSLILLIIALPMLAIAIGLKLSSPGSVFFKQRRYGLNGKVVLVWKFRTMTVSEDGDIVPQAKKNDPRITKFGAFLRRNSLDELPQFFNVMQGNMSIVGPRPHAISHNEDFRRIIRGYMLRHKVRPGITGWAQICGWRGETDTSEKMQRRVECDLEYISNWSLWFDLKIIFLTIIIVWGRKKVY